LAQKALSPLRLVSEDVRNPRFILLAALMQARSTGLEVVLWPLGYMARPAAFPAGLGPPVRVGESGGVEAQMVDTLPGEGGAEFSLSKDVHVFLAGQA
jgi:hypothetical protein